MNEFSPFANIYGEAKTGPSTTPQATASEVFWAGMEQENDLYNLAQMIDKPNFEPDPEFKVLDHFYNQKLPHEFLDHLLESTSQKEFDFRLGRVQQELKNKAILASAGAGGFTASLGAGVLSPTIFIPFAGAGARGARLVGQAMALGAVGASASEAALYFNQETRTEMEVVGGVAMGTLLSGGLGIAFSRLDARAQAALARSIEEGQTRVDIPVRVSGADVGSVPTVRRADMDEAVSPSGNYETYWQRKAAGREQPDEVRDAAATPRATVEPPLAPGMVRLYHSGSADNVGERWVSTDRTYAADYREDTQFFYTDVPRSDPRLQGAYPEQGVDSGATFSFELTAEEAGSMVEVYRGRRIEADNDMADNAMLSTIPDSAPITRNVSEGAGASAGAAAVRVQNASGNVRPRNAAAAALFDAGGKLNPLYRMMNNKLFPSLRDAAAKLDDGGLQQAGLETMQPSAAGGTVQSRVRLGDVAVYKFAFKLDEAYLNYLYPGQKFTRPQVAALAAQVRSFFGKQPAGKMSFPEFKARAHDDYVQDIDNPDTNALKPAIKEFYAHYEKMQEEYLVELQQTGAEVKPLFKVAKAGDGLESGAQNYLHEVYDKNLVGDRSDEFIKDMADQNEKELQSWFQKSYARYEARRAKARNNLELAKLGPEGVNKAFRETQEDLDVLLESPEFINYASSRKEIRDQARLEGWSREELKAALDDLNANVDDNTQSILDSIVETRKALSNIRKLGGDAESRIETLAEQLQKVEDRYYAKIESGLPGLRSLDLRVDSLVARGEKGVAKAAKTMQGQLDNLRKIEQARIEQMRKSRSSPKTMARLEERHVKAQARLDMAEAKMREAEQKNLVLGDKADALNEARVALVDATVEMLRRNGSRADELAAKIEAQEARILTPEEYAERVQKMQDEFDDMEIEFERRIGDKGGEITGEGQANFREKAVEEATYFYQKLMGSDARPSEVFLRQSERGPALERMMKLPYDVKQKYLVKDLELLSRVYNRSMAPDLEIWRAFDGSVNGDTVIKQIDQETINLQLILSQATHVKLPKQFMLKAAAFGEKVKNRLASLEDSDTLFIDEKNFASEAKEGFTEMTPEVRSALSKYINDMRDAGVRDFDIAIQRLRHTRGVPEDANSIMYRTGRVIKDMNVVTLMGKVMFSSIPDLARPVAKYGLGHVMSKAWLPMITGLRDNQGRSFRIASKEINRNLGINLEPVMHSRAQSMFDVADEVAQGKTMLERGVKFASNKMGIVAMFDYWTAGMKSVAAAATHATLAEYIPRVGKQLMDGKALGSDEAKMVVKLRDLGLRDTDILRISQQMAAPNGMEVFSNGARIANPDQWSDPGAYRAYAAALQTDVNRMIITPGLERPNWVDENLAYSMVAQFKSFTFASTQRVLMAGLQGNEPYLAQAALFSLALGGVSYYASAYANGGKSLERANKLEMDDWIYESVDRSGLLGVLSWPQQVGEQIPALNQYAIFGGEDKQFRRPYGGFGALLGPTASKAEDMLALAKTFDENGMGNGNERRIKNLFVPYQNVFYIQKLFSLLDEN